MQIKFFLGAAALFVCVAYTGRVSAQANVVENEPVTIYVNGQSGSNSHPGTSSEPVATIQQGVNLAITQEHKSVGARVLISPGVYRESVTLASTSTSAPITVEAATAGTVYIDASNVLSNGDDIGSGIYSYAWSDSVGGCPLPSGWPSGMPPVVLANEMVFVNGAQMTQVMSSSQLVPGTFYVDTSDSRVEVDPIAGTDMATAQVEVSARRTTLTLDAASNVVIRGLVLQHAAACMDVSGAEVNSGSNILFDNVQANWNNWGGMGVNNSKNVTVQNSTASYNGGVGFNGFQVQNGLFLNNKADYNNWRGEQAAFYDWAQGGFKFLHGRNLTVNGQHSYNNQAEGLWFDTDNENITVEDSDLVGNAIENLKLEANEGPFTVTGNTLCSGGVGVILMDSAGVTLKNNYLYGNQSSGSLATSQNAQVYLAGNSGGRTYTNFLTGATVTTQNTHITFSGNKFADAGSGQYLFNTYLNGYAWTDFLDTFQSDGNTWWDPSNSDALRGPNGDAVSLSGWRGLTGQDASSDWASVSPATACQVPTPVYTDFALLARNTVNYLPSYSMSGGRIAIPLQLKSFDFGPVQLSVKGLPTGVGAGFSSSSLASGNSVLTLTSSTSVKSQKVLITIFATSSTRVHTLSLWVNVNPS
jgi:parallel beta-helix repeat protein